ncbi:DHHC palmitoyltransferase-domain-containing protein [Dendryphion nanum]|uniref:Palmitoyltransferase n=1 Tax=Dendryphion nanum TaxID=256645 RepID=A0A9P9E249_9PLEO|nr:DHHC palmitoyltransferase-domain-containing protein [Dendryphion nanum]
MAISEERQNELDRKANQIMSIILPLLEVGGLGYASYVVIYLICVNYLLNPSTSLQDRGITPRTSTGIALIVIYCVLILVFSITFLRLIQVIWTNPGYIPLGDPTSEKQTAPRKHFDRLDGYECDHQGSPLWCERCHSFKPDRTHHSAQLGRCVRRMDHYCPYAGGIISETSHKFFIQFLFYGFLYTGFVLIVTAYYFAERKHKLNSSPATWIVALSLAALFFLFTFGMFMTSFYNLSTNQTTIEVMQRDFVHYIALRGSSPGSSTFTSDQSVIISEIQRSLSRSFIIVQTEPGTRLWDAGPLANIRSIMGNNVFQWFLPIGISPCLNHTDQRGEFQWGRVAVRLMNEHNAGTSYRRSRRRSASSRTT